MYWIKDIERKFLFIDSYYDYLNSGSLYHSTEIIKKHLSALGFIYKEENCIGLQIADMIPSILLRKISKKKDNFNMKTLFYDRLYCNGEISENILGFKKIL